MDILWHTAKVKQTGDGYIVTAQDRFGTWYTVSDVPYETHEEAQAYADIASGRKSTNIDWNSQEDCDFVERLCSAYEN